MVIKGQKEQTIFCITFWYSSSSDASFQQITFPEYHIYSKIEFFARQNCLGKSLGLISSFLSNRWLHVVLDGKFSQEYPVHTGVPQGSILSLTLFLLYIKELLDNVICNIAMYADDTTLYSKCDQTSELESDLQDIVDWSRKWLVDFNAGKT